MAECAEAWASNDKDISDPVDDADDDDDDELELELDPEFVDGAIGVANAEVGDGGNDRGGLTRPTVDENADEVDEVGDVDVGRVALGCSGIEVSKVNGTILLAGTATTRGGLRCDDKVGSTGSGWPRSGAVGGPGGDWFTLGVGTGWGYRSWC